MKRWMTALAMAGILLCGGSAPAQGTHVRLPDDVTADMLHADYWLSGQTDAGQVRMTREEIDRISAQTAVYAAAASLKLSEIGETLSGELVRSLVVQAFETIPDDPFTRYVDGKPTDAAYWDALRRSCRVEEIPNRVSVGFGFSVRRAGLRRFPSEDFIGQTAEDTFYDQGVNSELLPYLPLCVLHESGEWLYVLLYGMAGWVQRDCVAQCSTRADWLARQSPEEVLVVTGRELRLTQDPLTPQLSNLLLPMGTMLPMVRAQAVPETVNGRSTYGNYVVRLPVRGTEGWLEEQMTLIPVSSDVHVGFLPYTRENVLRLAFKLLGDRYGWAGMFGANDCSGIVHEIFACFGFVLPRTAQAQAALPGMRSTQLEGSTLEEKQEALRTAPAGCLLYFPGHIMLYLGEREEKFYVISAAGSFAQSDETENVSAVLINTLNVKRRDGSAWLDNLTIIQWMEP